MKINTKDKKKTTPMKKYSHSYYQENKCIPGASVGDFDDSDDDEPTVGRVVRYETILVTTPILTSARTQNKKSGSSAASSKGNAQRLSKDEVDEISARLSALYIRDASVEASLPATKHVYGTLEVKTPEPTETFLGRCSLVIYNSATRGFIEVIRSARLALKSF